MARRKRLVITISALFVALLGARPALAVAIGDLVRFDGEASETITGLGIVVGLNQTGDQSEEARAAARPYARLLGNLGNPIADVSPLTELGSFAVVMVSATIPARGLIEGDRLDVRVDTMFNAESLEGGRLVPSLLRLPVPDAPDLLPVAIADGAIELLPGNPTSARIRNAGLALTTIDKPVVNQQRLRLVLNRPYATYSNAAIIEAAINEPTTFGSGGRIARVLEGARVIEVDIPDADADHPAAFIAWLEEIEIDASLLRPEARVVIDRQRGIITATADVAFSPVVFTQGDLQLGAGGNGGGAWTAFDPGRDERDSQRLGDLLAMLNQMSVTVEEQIDLILQLEQTGALHATVIEVGR